MSACASLANVIRAPTFKLSIGPHTYLLVFSCFYLAYCVVLGVRLAKWDNSVEGQCYNTGLIAAPGAPHPLTDHVYLSIMCFYMFSSISLCWECGEIQNQPHAEHRQNARAEDGGNYGLPAFFTIIVSAFQFMKGAQTASDLRARLARGSWLGYIEAVLESSSIPLRREITMWLISVFVPGDPSLVRLKATLLTISLCQFPLHTYMIFALRYSNEHRLSGDSENAWGFGQILALVLLGSTLVQSMGTIISTSYFFSICANQFPLTNVRLSPTFGSCGSAGNYRAPGPGTEPS